MQRGPRPTPTSPGGQAARFPPRSSPNARARTSASGTTTATSEEGSMSLAPNGRPEAAAEQLTREWNTAERWGGIERSYQADEVVRLRGSVQVDHTLARLGAERLWDLLSEAGYVATLGAMTGGQAVQMAKAGL